MSDTITSIAGAAPVRSEEARVDVPFTVVNLATTAAACVLPFYFYSRSAVAAFLLFYMATSLSLTAGYHRLFSHRSYEVPRWLAHLIAGVGYLAVQRGPVFWVAMHRMHHRFSDVAGRDPHTPREGLWHVHFGWHQRRRRDVWDPALYRKWVPELVRDRFYLLLDDERLDYAACFGLLAGSFAVGGLVGGLGRPAPRFDWHNAVCFLVWVGLLNRVLLLHAFGLINSVCHRWGTRPFRTHGADGSVNNFLVALVIHGEGWHNNHHAHPHSARHGLRWYQWDPAWYSIRLLKALGLARNVYVPSAEAIRKASLANRGKSETVTKHG